MKIEKDTLTDLFVAPLGPALDILCEHLGLVGVDPPAVPRDPQWRIPRDERRHLLWQLPRPQRDVAHVVQDQVLRPPARYSAGSIQIPEGLPLHFFKCFTLEGCSQPPSEIKTKVPFLYEDHILKRNLCFGVNPRLGTT